MPILFAKSETRRNTLSETKQSVDACQCGCWIYISPSMPRKDLELEYNGRRYNLTHQPNHPYADKNGDILTHRLVMEKYLERYLHVDEHILHIQDDKDDSLDNLLLKTAYEPHMTKHKYKPPEKSKVQNFDSKITNTKI